MEHKPYTVMFDIDDTITALPDVLSLIHNSGLVKRTIVISTRTNRPEFVNASRLELKELGIFPEELIHLNSFENMNEPCPHKNLSQYQQYIWQKVNICKKSAVNLVFEDDTKVIELFKKYAPEIQVVQIHRRLIS